jgi:hypothetical protein
MPTLRPMIGRDPESEALSRGTAGYLLNVRKPEDHRGAVGVFEVRRRYDALARIHALALVNLVHVVDRPGVTRAVAQHLIEPVHRFVEPLDLVERDSQVTLRLDGVLGTDRVGLMQAEIPHVQLDSAGKIAGLEFQVAQITAGPAVQGIEFERLFEVVRRGVGLPQIPADDRDVVKAVRAEKFGLLVKRAEIKLPRRKWDRTPDSSSR